MRPTFHSPRPARGGSSRLLRRMLLCAALALCSGAASSHSPSINECTEGSDFIRNAALARDNGVSENSFMERLRQDIELIQAFPPALRWFVQDDDDAGFLIAAAGNVFQQPKTAATHQEDFFRSCLGKSSGRKTFGL
jgi:hypothetical protein